MGKTTNTKYGTVEGFSRNGCTVYLGIPFAKPPVGELAFKHPLPPEPWEGVLKATKGSSNPIQGLGSYATGNDSPDCLYLNVFVPEGITSPCPVMVWIYGGSYEFGGAGAKSKGTSDIEYDLSGFAGKTGCIVVTFNYRINLYGFMNLSFLGPDFDVNNGLYDQIMALRFVKDNISAFGGDPGNVTLFGQSAGAACTLAQMCIKESQELFHKAIVQSACIEHFFTEAESLENAKAYMRLSGLESADSLKAMGIEELTSANRRFSKWLQKTGDIRCAFSPVIDGKTLTGQPKEVVKSSQKPLLIGNTLEEFNIFMVGIPTISFPFLSRRFKVKIRKGNGSYRQRVSETFGDHVFIRPQLEILDGYKGPAWRYEFRYTNPESTMGCFHACELSALFGLDIIVNHNADGSERVGNIMRASWGSFAKKGDPGWDKYTTGSEPFVIE